MGAGVGGRGGDRPLNQISGGRHRPPKCLA